MYSNLPGEIRERHPYFMYNEIRAQPEAVSHALATAQSQGPEVADLLARARRIVLVGCGTSFHAARAGADLFQTFSAGSLDARAVQAFEFVHYLPAPRPDDLVLALTHSGGTAMTLRALERARQAGAETVAVTGFVNSPAAQTAGHVLSTGYEQERSWAHTVSYTAALTALAFLANSLAVPAQRIDLSPLPAVMADALQLEEMAHRLAGSTLTVERFREPPPLVVVGGGPNVVTAQEAVLKLLETSFVTAAAFELEEMLHGPLAAVTSEALVVVLAPPGPSVERAGDLVRALRELEVVPVVLTGEEAANVFEEAHRLLLPEVPEALSPLPYVVPLQLFSYFLAVGKGINPDLLHRDDDRYRAARAQYL